MIHSNPRSRRVTLALSLALLSTGCGGGPSAAESLANGQAALERGEWRTAVIEFKNALSEDPQNATIRMLLGQSFVRLGDYASAEQELERAQRLGAPLDQVQPWLATAWLRLGKFQSVLDLALDETPAPAARAWLLALQSEAALANGQLEDAAARAAAALELDGQSSAALRAQALVARRNGDLAAARDWLTRALAADDTDAQVWRLLGDLERAEGQLDAADAAFTKAMAAPAETLAAQMDRLLTRIQANRGEDARADLDALRKRLKNNPQLDYAEGLLAYNEGQHARAIEFFNKALGAAPNLSPALFFTGASHLAVGNLEQAQINLRRFLSTQPQHLPAQRLLAQTLLQAGRAAEAEDLARRALEQDPNDPATLELLANALIGQGKTDEGLTYLRQVKSVIPDSPGATARLGAALLEQGDAEAGLRELQEALRMEPGLQGAAEQLVAGYVRAGKLDEAMEEARQLRERQPDSVAALALLGAVHLVRQEPAEAEQAFREALEREPGHLAATNGLATLALQRQDLDAALGHLTAALEHRPDDVNLLVAAARLSAARGQAAQSKTYLERAAQVQPQALAPAIYLSALALREGQAERAWELLTPMRAAHSNNPALLGLVAEAALARQDFAEADAVLAQLATLTPDDPRVPFASARAAAALGDTDRVRTALAHSLKLNPTFVPGLLAATRQAIVDKDTALANRHLATLGKQLAPDSPEFVLIRGQVAQFEGNDAAALDALRALIGGDTQDPGELSAQHWAAAEQLVLGFVRAGRDASALQAVSELRERQPRAARAHSLFGAVALRGGETERATQAFQQALALEPGQVAASGALANLALRANDPAAAERYLKQSLEQHPGNLELLTGLARLALKQNDATAAIAHLREAVASHPRALMPKLQLAELLTRQGDAVAAIGILTPERAAHPANAMLLGLLAQAQLGARDFRAAAATLDALRALRPDDAKVLVAVAQAQLGQGQVEPARATLEQALAADPGSAAAASALARLALAERNAEDAQARIETLRAILQADQHAEILLLQGQLAELQTDWPVAVARYRALLETTPALNHALLLARALAAQGDLKGAEQTLTEWLAQHPKDGQARLALAQFYLSKQRDADAIKQFEQALELTPDNPVVLNNLAWLLREQDPQTALRHARTAYAKAPESVDVADTLAMVLLDSGDPREALAISDRVIAMPGGDRGTFLFHRARILAATDDRRGAVAALRKALGEDGQAQFPERDEARSLLATLTGG